MTTARQTTNIRRMLPDDVEPLADALGWPSRGVRARWEDAERGRREMFVSEHEGRVAGSVSINVHDHLPEHLHLFALDVSPALQRRGIGTALITAVENEAKERGFRGVWLAVAVENTNARRLYERLGYVADAELMTLRYSVPDGGGWRDVEEPSYRMFRAFDGATS
jgi:ribosomal protein S18 acetylase RimI-like enzyme